MALELTATQAEAILILTSQAIDLLTRIQTVKTMTDEECQGLIDAAKLQKKELDERLEKH
jgi:hypothetical protein